MCADADADAEASPCHAGGRTSPRWLPTAVGGHGGTTGDGAGDSAGRGVVSVAPRPPAMTWARAATMAAASVASRNGGDGTVDDGG